MNIPGLGNVIFDEDSGWYCSKKIKLDALNGHKCRIVLEDYNDDENKEDFHKAIANFLSIDFSVLKKAEPHLFRYYKNCMSEIDADDEEDFPQIDNASEVWDYIEFGEDAIVQRRAYGDQGVYISIESECDWEPEHGLQIVFKNGLTVNKLGPFDGHLTNSDAYDDETLENVVYR